MGFWSHVRSCMYGTAIVAFSLTTIRAAMWLAGATSGTLLLIALLAMIVQIALYTGKHYTSVFSNQPIDPNTDIKTVSIAALVAAGLQLGTSFVHNLISSPADSLQLVMTLDGFILAVLTIGIMFPVFEELLFRHLLWNTTQKIESLRARLEKILGLGTKPISTVTLTRFAAVTTAVLFLLSHVNAWGWLGAAMLIPITCWFTYLRIKTGGFFTSSVAHIVFNTVAVLTHYLA